MIYTLEDVAIYSRCPRKFKYWKETAREHLKSVRQATVEHVIKQCYLETMQKEIKVEWRHIVGLVDAQIFQSIDTTNKEGWEAGKNLAEQILRTLERWYALVYPNLVYETFIDLTLKKPIGDHFIECHIPIIQLADTPALTFIREGTPNLWECWNDMKIRYTCSVVAEELLQDNIIAIILGIGERGGLDIKDITTCREDNLAAIKAVTQIVKNIAAGVDYLAVDDNCKNCRFIGKCKI